jgi:hypothetical protein
LANSQMQTSFAKSLGDALRKSVCRLRLKNKSTVLN